MEHENWYTVYPSAIKQFKHGWLMEMKAYSWENHLHIGWFSIPHVWSSPVYSSMIVTFKSYMICINIYIYIYIHRICNHCNLYTKYVDSHVLNLYPHIFVRSIPHFLSFNIHIIADWSPSFAVLPGVSTANIYSIYSCYCFNLHYE